MFLYCYVFTGTCIFRRSCKLRQYQLHIGHPLGLQSSTLSSITAIGLWRIRQTLWVTKLSSLKSQYFPPHSNTGLQLLLALCHRTAAFSCGTEVTVKMQVVNGAAVQTKPLLERSEEVLGGANLRGELCTQTVFDPKCPQNQFLFDSDFMNLPHVNHPTPFHSRVKEKVLILSPRSIASNVCHWKQNHTVMKFSFS